jgi:hypothetical protein
MISNANERMEPRNKGNLAVGNLTAEMPGDRNQE